MLYNLYMITFTINIPRMLAYVPYMDPMGYINISIHMEPPRHFLVENETHVHVYAGTYLCIVFCICLGLSRFGVPYQGLRPLAGLTLLSASLIF